MANFVSNEDALEVLDKYAKGIKKGIGVVAVRETSPAAAAHAVGDYIRYSGTVYKVKSAISIGDSLILNTNIEANGLPDDTTIYTPGLDEENFSEEISDIVNVYGNKNLLPVLAASQTIRDVDFTKNSDGSITADGTATGGSANLNYGSVQLSPGTYILSGCPGEGSTTTYYLRLGVEPNASYVDIDMGTGCTFTVSQTNTYQVNIMIESGTTVSDLTFRPMIRCASIKDSTYASYAMTNRELTERVESSAWRDITSQCTFNTTDLSFYNQKVFDNGFAYLVTGLLTNIQNISDMTNVVTLPRNAIARGGQSGITSGNFGTVEDVRVGIGISPNTNTVTMSVGNWSATGSRNFTFSFLVPHA